MCRADSGDGLPVPADAVEVVLELMSNLCVSHASFVSGILFNIFDLLFLVLEAYLKFIVGF